MLKSTVSILPNTILHQAGQSRRHYALLLALLFSPICLFASSLPTVGNEKADAHIVRLAQQGYKVNGATLSFDAHTLYLSLCKAPREVFDLYVCTFKNGRWSVPVIDSALSTDNNEWEPSLCSDEQTIYFVREEVRHNKNKKEYRVTNLYSAVRGQDGSWQQPQQLVTSNGTDRAPVIMTDNKTLCFTSKRGEDKEPKRYFITKIDKYNWNLPQPTNEDVAEESKLGKPIMQVSGTVTATGSGKTQEAHITISDALTFTKLAEATTDKGEFRIALTQGRRYLIDVTQDNFSHDYYTVNVSNLTENKALVWNPKITPQINIGLSVYDADNMAKIRPNIEITDAATKQRIQTIQKEANGTARLRLTIGKDYIVHLSLPSYADTTVHIDTRREVRFADTEIDLQMVQGKVPVRLTTVDAETGEAIASTAAFINKSEEEDPLDFEVAENGTIQTLRCATTYDLQISKTGYLYKDTTLRMPNFEQKQPLQLQVALNPLRKEAVVRLKNIEFEFNSYLLKEESFLELHQVAELLRKNPSLRIEIAAHTDDIGSDAYNLRLSKKRGEAAAEYLIKQENISPSQLKTVGYGKTKPLVPNDSDEHRAINRRVEFTIIEL